MMRHVMTWAQWRDSTTGPLTATSRAVVVMAAVAVSIALVGCSRGEAPSAERFCGEVAENADALTNPTIIDNDDVGALLELYRRIGELAPLAVEDDWNQLVSAYATAATVVPGDAASEQVALAAIYSSERSAAAVHEWLRVNCAVDLGPIATLVPHG